MGADRDVARAGRARLGPPALVVAGLAAGLLLACGGGDGGSNAPPTPTVSLTAIQATAVPAGSPGPTVEGVVQACREKDVERLKSLVAGAIGDEEVRELFSRGSDVRLGSYTLEAPAEREAIAFVGLEIRRDASTEQVSRTWRLVQGDDGVWRLTGLPDCY